MFKKFALAAALSFLPPALSAQSPPERVLDLLKLSRTQRIVISPMNGRPTLDGRSDDPAWQSVLPFPMIMQTPNFGDPPSERTEALFAFDDKYLYVAGRLYDREPEKIQAPTKKRDAMVATTDWFGVLFDTFNDKENALAFFTTPSGLRFDAAVFRDCQTTSPTDLPINLSWNTFWDVAAARTEDGWFVEMRIPLSSLRFQEKDGRVVMGVSAFRWLARRNETDVFPAIPKNWGDWSAWKPSQAQEVEFPGLRSHRPLYLTPYVLAGRSRTDDLNDEETAYVRTNEPEFELGLDVKYGLTSNLTLDLTANPDFAQVEADDVVVNLTRFSLFIPEKRLFFQERSSNFDFNMGGPNTLFYSRQIGLSDGRPVRIYGGARVVGRLGGWDVGFLDMQTASLDDLSSENFGILRLRRQVINPFSYVGGIITSRIGADGSYNVAYGLDGIWRVGGDNYLSFHWAQTYEDGAANRPLSFDATKFALIWERRTQKGLGYNLRFSRAGPDFNPGLGFMMRENYTAVYNRWLYGWFPGKDSPFTNHDVFVEGRFYWSNVTKEVESVEFGPGWEFSAKSGFGGMIWPKLMYENVAESFELSEEAIVPPGRYTFAGLEFLLQTPPGRLFNALLTAEAGSFYDGWRVSLGAVPTWSGIPDLEIGGMLQYNRVMFPKRGQSFFAPLAQFRILATLSVKFSANALVQYDGADDSLIANFRLRYNPREGTDVYLVYNEGLNTGRAGKIPYPPLSSGRTVALKLNYTFNF
jgi:hypothetical protein